MSACCNNECLYLKHTNNNGMYCCRACKNNVGHGPRCEKRLQDSVLPTAYCINLDREPWKFQNVRKEFNEVLHVVKVSAVDGKKLGISGREGLRRTNKILFRKFASPEYTLPYAIVLEDDIYKLPKFNEYWPNILNFIHEGGSWDFITLDFHCQKENPVIRPYNSFLYTIKRSVANGFMIYNTNFIRNNLQYLLSINRNVDTCIKWYPEFAKQLIPKHLIVKQNVNKLSGTSNCNTKRIDQMYEITEKFLRIHSNSKDAGHSK